MSKTIAWAEGTFTNVTEPFTVMLTNEAQQFATDSNRKVTSAQSYYTDIIVIRGSQERTDYTIGNITSGSGITVSKSSKRVTFSVSADTTIGADTGVIEIPITLDGQTVKKQFSWSCGKQGPQGVQGNDGNSFAWNMLSETNCGKKHWGTESSGVKYSVEDFITEDNIDAVKLICTEAISTSNWSYVSFKDIKMLKQLKPSTKYTLSYDIKANRSGAISHSICKGDVSNFCTNTVVVNNIIGNETWQHISVVLTTNDLKTTPTNEILYLGRNALSKVGYSIIKNLKLVEGDIDTPWSPSQSDIEGKGVVETVQYYLATSQASGVTSSTSGWSTDITTQKLTADKKYLWNCYQTKYSDGTSEPISTPKVIGVYGDKGQNAKNLSITPSSQYFKSTDGGKTFAPNTITIKPTIQGEISFGKWQYSIDGGVSFTDVVSGQKGLTISNNVLTVSKNSTLYNDAVTMVTFRAVANDSSFYDTCSIAKIYDVSDIGDGRNLLLNTSSYRESNPLERTGSNTDDYSTYPKIITSIDLSANQKYTLQAKTDSNWATKHDTGGHTPSEKLVGLWLVSDDTNTFLDMSKGYAVFTAPKTTKYKLRVNQYSDGTNSYTIRLWDIKLEKGQSASGWSPAPEDVQTAILSTKSEISDVSLKVDKNKQAIEQRVEKTTYQQDLNLVKGDISKANEGLNKWRYEIYPKNLFVSEYQGKSTMDVFAKNTNLTPSQSVLINDTDLSIAWNYAENYIGYALTFTKFSAAKSVAITFAHDDGAHIYLNGKLIGGSDAYNSKGESLTLGFVKGWNCIEVVVNEGASTEGFKLGTTLSALSECQLMNCYYGTPVARQSHITNQLVQNTTDIEGVSTTVQNVMTTVGDSGNITDFKTNYTKWKQGVNGIESRVGQTYTTKDEFNGLEIGGRNLLLYSQTIRAHNNYYDVGWLTDEVETFNGCPVWSVKNRWGRLVWLFKSHVIDRGLVKVGDTLTYSLYAKTNNASGKSINCSYRFKGNAQAYWFKGSAFNIGTSWTRCSVTFTVTQDMLATDTYMSEIGFEETAFMSGDDKVYYACPKLERGTKATDYTPAPEDNEINGQNLVSNLPANWEQGSINYTANLAYGSLKSTLVSRLRTKDVFPVSGNITISAGTSTNSSKEELNFYYVLFDINKKSISHGDTWQSLTSPKIINCGDAKYMAIILRWGSGSTAITPSDISKICLKIERGTSATPFTLAPEDVNGKIVNVETIATQTATEIGWLINRNGSTASSLKLTENALTAIAENINLTGKVKFSSLSADAKQGILNSFEVGGRNLLVQKNITQGFLSTDGKGSFIGSGGGDQTSDWIDVSGNKYITITLYEDFTNTNNSGRYCEYDADKNCISTIDYNPRQKSSVIIELKSNTKYIRVTAIECKTRRYKIEAGNKATDWTPAPEDVSQDATNKASQALTDAKNYSSNAVNWVTSNGSSTTNLNSMVKKWTDGAVSDTTQINGGWIKANTITASKIAIGDFTNYCQLDKDTASSYGFTATDDEDGIWYTADPIKRDKEISQWFTCEDSQKLYVEYDISTTVQGKVNSSDTDNSYLHSGIMIFATDGNKKAISYIRTKDATAAADGIVTHVSVTETLPTWARFFKVFLQTNGQNGSFSGVLKIRNLQVRKATTGKLIVDGAITADKINVSDLFAKNITASGTIQSNNYAESNGAATAGSKWILSDGSFKSKNLSWDASGNITAAGGKIGKYTITDSYLITGSGATASGFGGNQAFWAGSSSSNDAPFRVGYNGQLVASGATLTNAIVSGDITAIKGQIGELVLQDGTLTGSGQIIKNKTDSSGNITSTTTTDYITKISQKGLDIESTIMSSDSDTTSNRGICVSPESIHLTYDGLVSRVTPQGLNILGSDSGQVAINNLASTFYYSDEGYRTRLGIDHQGILLMCEDGNKTFKINVSGADGMDISGANVRLQNNITASRFVFYKDSFNYIESLEANNTNNIYFHSNGYYSFRVNNEGNWSNETQSVYITERGISVPGEVGLYSQEMSNYVARYYVAGSTKCTAIGNGSYNTRIYGSSVWTQKAVSTSDVRLKQDFQPLDKFEDLYMNLQPVSFKYIDGYDKSEDRYFGLKAQPTEKLFEDMGENPDDYAMFNKFGIDHEDIKERLGHDVDFDEEHGLDYTNMIALNTHMVQKTRREAAIDHREIEILKAENAELKATLQAIMTKLNMQQN